MRRPRVTAISTRARPRSSSSIRTIWLQPHRKLTAKNMKRIVLSAAAVAALILCWGWSRQQVEAAAPPPQQAAEGRMSVTAVGHEFRQDDLPSIAAAPDGSLWVAWLSFVGDRDDIALRS